MSQLLLTQQSLICASFSFLLYAPGHRSLLPYISLHPLPLSSARPSPIYRAIIFLFYPVWSERRDPEGIPSAVCMTAFSRRFHEGRGRGGLTMRTRLTIAL